MSDDIDEGEPGERIYRRFDEARVAVTAVLGELVAEGIATPSAIVDAIGFDDLERYLPVEARTRLLAAAIAAGRRGAPFTDVTLLNVATPDLLARSLPIERLREVIEALCHAPSPDELGDDDLAPPSVAAPTITDQPSDGEAHELSPDSVEMLPSSRRMPSKPPTSPDVPDAPPPIPRAPGSPADVHDPAAPSLQIFGLPTEDG